MPNATVAVNTVARSLRLGPGDEVLATDLEYGAVDRTWQYLCARAGATYVRQPIPLPVQTPEALIEALWQGVTPHTRVICVSHITSQTALILPVAEICRRARAAGILTVIDGAHVPGQLDLDLGTLGADFYAGNCHKWLCAPKGAGFLYARPERQALVDPLVVSWGWMEDGTASFVDRLEWTGTRDIAAPLSVPAAIAFQAARDWPRRRVECHALLQDIRRRVNALTGLPPLCPDSPAWYGQLATMWLPPCDPLALQARLWDEARVEVPLGVAGTMRRRDRASAPQPVRRRGPRAAMCARVECQTARTVDDRRTGERERIAEMDAAPLSRHEVDELYGTTLVEALEANLTVLGGPGEREDLLPADFYRRLSADLVANGRVVVVDLSGEPLRERSQVAQRS